MYENLEFLHHRNITDEALIYNSRFPEAREEILAGTEHIDVHVKPVVKDRVRYWRVRVYPGVELADGSWASCGEPEVAYFRIRRGDKPERVAYEYGITIMAGFYRAPREGLVRITVVNPD